MASSVMIVKVNEEAGHSSYHVSYNPSHRNGICALNWTWALAAIITNILPWKPVIFRWFPLTFQGKIPVNPFLSLFFFFHLTNGTIILY